MRLDLEVQELRRKSGRYESNHSTMWKYLHYDNEEISTMNLRNPAVWFHSTFLHFIIGFNVLKIKIKSTYILTNHFLAVSHLLKCLEPWIKESTHLQLQSSIIHFNLQHGTLSFNFKSSLIYIMLYATCNISPCHFSNSICLMLDLKKYTCTSDSQDSIIIHTNLMSKQLI